MLASAEISFIAPIPPPNSMEVDRDRLWPAEAPTEDDILESRISEMIAKYDDFQYVRAARDRLRFFNITSPLLGIVSLGNVIDTATRTSTPMSIGRFTFTLTINSALAISGILGYKSSRELREEVEVFNDKYCT